MRTVILSRDNVARGLIIAAAAGLVLLVSTPVPATPPAGSNGGVSAHRSVPTTARGFRVELDESGTPVTPEDERAAVRAPAVIGTAPAAPPPLVQTKTAGGGTAVLLDERFHRYGVARIGADGRVAIDCVDGHPHAGSAAGPETR